MKVNLQEPASKKLTSDLQVGSFFFSPNRHNHEPIGDISPQRRDKNPGTNERGLCMKLFKTKIFTHNDLDGIGCAILAKHKFGKTTEVTFCGYEDVDEKVSEYLNDLDRPEEHRVLITDISVNRQTAILINNLYHEGLEITLLDHHKTALWLNEYAWAKVDESKSGTLLTFEHLGQPFDFLDFVIRVNDYDLWFHDFPESKELNRLYYLTGRERFVKRFIKNPCIKFTESEKTLLEIDNERRERYLERVAASMEVYLDPAGKRVGIAYADQYVSEIGNNLINRFGLDYVALFDALGCKVSLRSRPDVDVSVIAKRFKGGGHKNAAGFHYNFKLVFFKVLSFNSNLVRIQP